MKLIRAPFILACLIMLCLAGCSGTSDQLSPRFNHVMLYVADLEKSIDFYTNAFDLEVTGRVTELRILPADGEERKVEVTMAFLRFPGQDFVLEIGQNTAGDSDGISYSYQHLGIDVENIEAAEKRLLAAGAKIVGPIQQVSATDIVARNSFYMGPDGELIELMQIMEGSF